MRLTVPQIIMLNHAAWVNSKRLDDKHGTGKKDTPDQQFKTLRASSSDMNQTYNGKTMDELTSEETAAYLASW